MLLLYAWAAIGVVCLAAFTLAPLIVAGGDVDESGKPEVKR